MREKPLKWRKLAALGRGVNRAVKLPFVPMGKRREVPEWIDAFFSDETLCDIGANVGTYSLSAASCNGISVLAFEPEASNYFMLTRNKAINAMWDRINIYCMALADETRFGELNLFHTAIGGSKHAFGDSEECWEADDPVVFRQGMIGFCIDGLIEQFGCAFPNHIKIDVDGIEEKIIFGAAKTLQDARLKSILLELQFHKPDAANTMTPALIEAGFELDIDASANVVYRRRSNRFQTRRTDVA